MVNDSFASIPEKSIHPVLSLTINDRDMVLVIAEQDSWTFPLTILT